MSPDAPPRARGPQAALVAFLATLLLGGVVRAEDAPRPEEEPPGPVLPEEGEPVPEEPAPDAPEPGAPALPSAADLAREDAAFARRVGEAIDRGVAWMKSRQMEDGSFRFAAPGQAAPLGENALAVLTLAKCGVGPREAEMARALRALDRLFSAHVGGAKWTSAKTYEVAVLVMAYEALYGHGPAKPPAEVVRRVRQVLAWLEKTQEPEVWRYPSADHSEDLSATQYALLAFEMGSRLGVTAAPTTYRRALTWLLALQAAEGPEVPFVVENEAWTPGDPYTRWLTPQRVRSRGWPYQRKGTVTGSMTAAGLASLAIVKGQLKQVDGLDAGQERGIDRALRDGLGWLGANFKPHENPGAGTSWHYYYLYGVERVGAFLGVRNLGEHDWYREGADYLLGAQTKDGSWPGEGTGATHPRNQTCFALLFLRRATAPPLVPVKPAVVTEGE